MVVSTGAGLTEMIWKESGVAGLEQTDRHFGVGLNLG